MTLLTPLSPSATDPLAPLRRAASLGDLESVRAQLAALSSPLPVDGFGNTVLRDAAEGDCAPVVRALLDHGEDVNQASRDGWTALMHAAAMGKLHAMRTLIADGADLHRVEKGFLQTALHLASDVNQIGAALLLIEAGVDLTVRDRNGQTAYDLAAENGHRRLQNLLGGARALQERAALEAALPAMGTEDHAGEQDQGTTGTAGRERRRL